MHRRPESNSCHRLDWEALRRHVATHDDLTQAEAARHFGVSRHCIWNALLRWGGLGKKRPGTKSAARCNDASFCVFLSDIFVEAADSCMSMNAASRLP